MSATDRHFDLADRAQPDNERVTLWRYGGRWVNVPELEGVPGVESAQFVLVSPLVAPPVDPETGETYDNQAQADVVAAGIPLRDIQVDDEDEEAEEYCRRALLAANPGMTEAEATRTARTALGRGRSM
jgi:hypothetical protein